MLASQQRAKAVVDSNMHDKTYFGCRKLCMQQRESNNQGMQNKQQGPHLREVHTCGVHTPEQGSPHESTESQPRSSS
jgi:hypothetical protein